VRANRYAGVPLDHWVLEANDGTAVFIQVETAGALNAACDIASEKWVDLLFVGPNDLSQALGVPGRYDDPRYVAGVERVASVAAEHGKAAGIMLRSTDQIPDLRTLGYSLFTTSDRSLLAQSAKAWRKALA
jgi:2-dehydro-3-deoxyglucarate aldolase/4-hydroxy-2-oxoheptanedioate aldolase